MRAFGVCGVLVCLAAAALGQLSSNYLPPSVGSSSSGGSDSSSFTASDFGGGAPISSDFSSAGAPGDSGSFASSSSSNTGSNGFGSSQDAGSILSGVADFGAGPADYAPADGPADNFISLQSNGGSSSGFISGGPSDGFGGSSTFSSSPGSGGQGGFQSSSSFSSGGPSGGFVQQTVVSGQKPSNMFLDQPELFTAQVASQPASGGSGSAHYGPDYSSNVFLGSSSGPGQFASQQGNGFGGSPGSQDSSFVSGTTSSGPSDGGSSYESVSSSGLGSSGSSSFGPAPSGGFVSGGPSGSTGSSSFGPASSGGFVSGGPSGGSSFGPAPSGGFASGGPSGGSSFGPAPSGGFVSGGPSGGSSFGPAPSGGFASGGPSGGSSFSAGPSGSFGSGPSPPSTFTGQSSLAQPGSVPQAMHRLNVNPGGGNAAFLGHQVGTCAASLICVPEAMCNPYTGFVRGGLLNEPGIPSDLPTVSLDRCNQLKEGGAGEGVCCQMPHINDPWPRDQ